MIFIMFLLLSISICNIFVAMFFTYPLALASMGLQLLLFLISFVIFLMKIKKRSKIIKSFIVTFLHGAALVLIINIFFTITIPNREKGDTDATISALKGVYKYFTSSTSKPEKPVQNIEGENNNLNDKKIKSEKPAPLVEDPPF